MWSVVPRLLNLDGEVENLLWNIRTEHIAKANVPGMGDRCSEWTVNDVVVNTGWRAELKIPEGAVNALMVPEHLMLEPVAGDNVMS
jgi:hypothetical protein